MGSPELRHQHTVHAPPQDRINCGADVDQGGIEKSQAFGLGAAEKERQLGAGEDDRFEAFFVAHTLYDAEERGAGRGLEVISAARECICGG